MESDGAPPLCELCHKGTAEYACTLCKTRVCDWCRAKSPSRPVTARSGDFQIVEFLDSIQVRCVRCEKLSPSEKSLPCEEC